MPSLELKIGAVVTPPELTLVKTPYKEIILRATLNDRVIDLAFFDRQGRFQLHVIDDFDQKRLQDFVEFEGRFMKVVA